MKNKASKIIFTFILVLASYGFILYKITNLTELKGLSLSSDQYTFANLLLLLTIITLMVLNWSIESLKWKTLIDKIQFFTFPNAFKVIFSGISIGIFTPNRIGEIGGRLLFLKKGNRTYGFLATSLGSFAQLITSLVAGFIGFVFFLTLFPDKSLLNPFLNKFTAGLIFVLLCIIIWIYFNFKGIKNVLLRFSFFKNRKDQLDYISETKSSLLFKVLFLSSLRYFVFICQFYLFLLIFQIHITFLQAYISISMIYLFSTLIPTTTLLELGVRGSLAIFFLGMFSDHVLGIVLSTTFLWIINLAIPSLIGSLFFVKKNIDYIIK